MITSIFLWATFLLSVLCALYLLLCEDLLDFITELENRDRRPYNLFWRLFIKEDKELEIILKEVIGIALKRGLPVAKYKIWRISFLLVSNYDGQILHNFKFGNIFISSFWTSRHSEDSMKILIAHELGHSIDMVSSKLNISHPFIDRIRKLNLDNEEFAWFIACYLFSKNAVMEYIKHYSGFVPNKLKNVEICNVHHKLNGVE